jgi:hypothetical protein
MLFAVLSLDLADFITRHRPCGKLTGDATEPAAANGRGRLLLRRGVHAVGDA